MNIANSRTGFGLSLIMVLSLAMPVANAQIVPPVEGLEGVNMIGLGAGMVPDYMGSSHNTGGIAPIFRYQFSGTERYIQVLGPQATFNLLNDQNWRFGPMLNYRGGRGSDVDDAVVKQMTGINPTVEAGVFVTYRMKLSQQKMHQINFSADVAGGNNGTVGNLRMMYWKPMSQATIINVGAGMTIADNEWMQTYFGITTPYNISLYPSLNGMPYNAGSGVKGVNIPFGVTHFLSKQWLLSGGGRYEKLMNDAKDSPVTSQRGSSDQWVFGAGLSYLF